MSFTHALVTRPNPQLEALATRLEQEGLQVIRMPAFRFEAREHHVAVDAAWQQAGHRLLIFTSPRSVQYGLPALEGGMLEAGTVAAIGPATAKALREAGLEPFQPDDAGYDSEAMLAALDRHFSPGAAVILAAPGGREALQQGLAARGWQVRLVPVYARVLIDPEPSAVAALEAADRVVSFWTSGVALTHLLGGVSSRARERVRSGMAVVISERLAALAREQGVEDIRIAAGPSNDDLLRCFAQARESEPENEPGNPRTP